MTSASTFDNPNRAASGVCMWCWYSYEIHVTYSIVKNDMKFISPDTALLVQNGVLLIVCLFIRSLSLLLTINGWVWRNLCDAPSMKVPCRCRVCVWLSSSFTSETVFAGVNECSCAYVSHMFCFPFISQWEDEHPPRCCCRLRWIVRWPA